jgi:hypothetical protein
MTEMARKRGGRVGGVACWGASVAAWALRGTPPFRVRILASHVISFIFLARLQHFRFRKFVTYTHLKWLLLRPSPRDVCLSLL